MRFPPAITWRLSPSASVRCAAGLTPEELLDGARYRHPGRYRQWRDGRLLAKALLLEAAPGRGWPGPSGLTIRRTAAGWPEPRVSGGARLPVSLSISHCQEWIGCAWCDQALGALGLDLERIEPRSPHFLEDFYTPGELTLISALAAADRDEVVTALWCIKEAVLKARKTGLSEEARAVSTARLLPEDGSGWRAVALEEGAFAPLRAWWRREGGLVLALALVPPGSLPG